jgi:RNA polymerase sigma-54 factor
MFASDASDYVVPDVIVKRGKNGWQVMLNHDVMPRLRVNAHVRQHAQAGTRAKGR